MPPRLITFDLDHTLWNPDRALAEAEVESYQHACQLSAAFGRHFSAEAFVALRAALMAEPGQARHRVSWLRQEAFRRAFTAVGHSDAESTAFADQAFATFYRARQRVELYPYSHALLQALQQCYTLGAISNGNACVRACGLADYFHFHYAGENFARAKPWPDMFIAAQQATAIPLSQTVHVGDSPQDDIWAARAVGATPLWYNPDCRPWPAEYGAAPLMVQALEEIEPLLLTLADAHFE